MSAAKQKGTLTTPTAPWIVRHRKGWCALPPAAEPDPDAFNDPTLCGYVVTMRTGSKRGMPTCPDCRAVVAGRDRAGGDQ